MSFASPIERCLTSTMEKLCNLLRDCHLTDILELTLRTGRGVDDQRETITPRLRRVYAIKLFEP